MHFGQARGFVTGLVQPGVVQPLAVAVVDAMLRRGSCLGLNWAGGPAGEMSG